MRINNQQMKGNDHDSKTNGPGNRGMAEAAHRRRLNSLRAEATKLIEGELGSPAFMMASLPMLLAYVLIDSRRVTHWICVGCTFASVLIHPIWIDAFNSGALVRLRIVMALPLNDHPSRKSSDGGVI